MQEQRYEELEARMREAEAEKLRQVEGKVPVPRAIVELSTDLLNLRVFLAEAVTKIEMGGKSRPRSLAITKLQEAAFWLNEEMRLS